MDYILVKPDIKYASEIVRYRQEFISADSPFDGVGSLREDSDPRKWIENCRLLESKDTLPPNMVLGTQYMYVRVSDRKIIGMIQVRHYFNDYLSKYGGNIGYSICPSERRKGHATAMLRMFLPICRGLGLKRVLITCLEDNIGSERTIIANGGVYESTVFDKSRLENLKRYWIAL